MQYSNRLINETSPYLLQHAHNPVNWYPWGEEAWQKAKEGNKPVLVSIGYSACHWCHVMERESFEDEATARIMNENFINIKIDREERPDLDHIYMDAVQAMTGSGGWPLNVFLTPDKKPFFGGTYFPPRRAFNRASWQEILLAVAQAFGERRHEIDAQAEELTAHLLQANNFGLPGAREDEIFSFEKTDRAFDSLLKQADKTWGGFGKAPKFPQTFSIQFLLRYAYLNSSPDLQSRGSEALGQARLSLDKMIEGGIYDQLGGGFARYSTDTEWLAPHFEKMLYDNALLVSVLSEAYQFTKTERYREVIGETIGFAERELMDESGGFYAALDADSEGTEGKFYVWSLAELTELLGDNAGIFCEFYDISETGNWEHSNILRVKKPLELFAGEKNIPVGELEKILAKSRETLMRRRNNRVRPSLDDKIILGWNALMNTACSKAFAATGREEYRQLAIRNMQFILDNFSNKDSGELHHTWKKGVAKHPAFLDDYAFLIEALIDLQEITGELKWLEKAATLAETVILHFDGVKSSLPGSESDRDAFFFYTPQFQEDLIVRKKELYDSALPSGNSVMAGNLYRLGILLDRPDWKRRAMEMTSRLAAAITRYPGSFGKWACLFQEMTAGSSEILILANDPSVLHSEVLSHYIPHRVLIASRSPRKEFPLLSGKTVGDTPAIYLCAGYSCNPPVFSANELISLINKAQKH